MDGAVLTSPVRAGFAAGIAVTRVALRAAGDVAGCTIKLAGKSAVAVTEAAARAAGGVVSDQPPWDRPARVVEPEIPPVQAEIVPIEAEVVEPEPPDEVVEPEPPHVSEEPELVEESAEPGAEDGAGAEVEIAEPWPGYRMLTAVDVIERIEAATPAELAAIELYERAHRNRQTVLDAAQRSLRAKTGQGSPDPDRTD